MTLPCTLPGLLVLLPYHVGFHLEGSLVVVALADAHVDLVERVDLPDDGPLDELTTARLVVALHHRGPSSLVVVAYGERPGAEVALTALVDAVESVAPVILAAMVRHDGQVAHWRDVPGGRWARLPAAADVPHVAEYVGRGVAPLPDRDALRAVLTRADDEDTRLAAALDRRSRPSQPEGLAAWGALLSAGVPGHADDDVVTALAFLREVADRDALVSRLVPMTTGGDPASDLPVSDLPLSDLPVSDRPSRGRWRPSPAIHTEDRARDRVEDRATTRAVLVHLARTAPRSVRPAALSVLALWAWRAGDGATASIAAELALAHDPTYTLASLVTRLIHYDVRPPTARPAGRIRA